MATIVEAVLAGMLVMLAGTIPRNILLAANLRFLPAVPWAVPAAALYLWGLWRYLGGRGSSDNHAAWRRGRLRARPLPASVWTRALIAGLVSLAALVIALRVLNRLVALPDQEVPDLSAMPTATIIALLLMSALNAGVVEESAFRGYMQGPIEQSHGPLVAILVTGVMFALSHLDFTPVLLPYYVLVAAIYGTVTYLTGSILPAIALHTAGNIYSNADLWLRGRAEWQAPSGSSTLIWSAGADRSFWIALALTAALAAAAVVGFRVLASAVKEPPVQQAT